MSPAHVIEAHEGVEVELHASSALEGSGQFHAPSASLPR